MRFLRKGHRRSVELFGDVSGQSSFSELNLLYVEGLRRAGAKVHLHERYEALNEAGPSDVLFVHPGWSGGQFNGTRGLRDRYLVAGFKDVLNYSSPGPTARAQLQNPVWDYIAMPYVPPTFDTHETEAKVLPWPDGIPAVFQSPVPARAHKVPRILVWAENASFKRKGHDLHARILREVQRRRRFDVFVKSRWLSRVEETFAGVRHVRVLPHYLDRESQMRLYDACDVLLHLHRGGGWELVGMEGISRGLVTLLPKAGAVLEYANDRNALLVPTGPWVPDDAFMQVSSASCDAGFGYECDERASVDLLEKALDELPKLANHARWVAPEFSRRWNMTKVVKQNWERLCRAFKDQLSRPQF